MKVHPAAEVFPMLPEDELQELAADIKEHGLSEALKVSNGFLVDGRNRLAACKIAGVEPQFQELNGIDPVSYILSANIRRRHLNKGQQAMVVAKIYPESEKRGVKSNIKIDFNRDYLVKARTVLAVLPELANQVIEGVTPLSEAYEKAQFERKAIELAETNLDALRNDASDLAILVDEARMSLAEALAAWEQRKSDEAERTKNQRETMIRLAENAYNSTVAWSVESFIKSVNESLCDPDFRTAFLTRVRINPSNLGEIQKGAKIFARLLTKLTK